MIINTLIFFLYIIFCTTSVYGYGILFSKFFLNNEYKNIGKIGILGFFLIFAISVFTHFFIELSQFLNLFFIFFGFVIGLKNINYLSNLGNIRSYVFIIIIIFLLSSITSNSYADYEWYHLPYVNYLNNFKIIFGLVNISNNYVYGHGWLDIMGLFTLPIINTNGLTALPIIFYFYFIIFFLYEIFNNKEYSLKLISLFNILISILIFNRVKDFGADIQPIFSLLICLFYIFKFSIQKNNTILKYIILFFFFSCVLRVGSVICLPLFIIFFILNLKKYLQDIFLNNIRIYIFLTFFFIIFLSKNLITTGCFFYPIPFTCFNNDKVTWASPIENVTERYELLSAIAKRWKFYSLEVGNLETKYDYYSELLNNKIMSPREYNSLNFYWLKFFFHDHDYQRLINIFIFSIIFFITSLYIIKKNNYLNDKFQFYNGRYILIGLFLSIIFWFFTSPQMRYGGYPIISSFFIYIIVQFLRNKEFNKIKFNYLFNIFFSIAIIYFGLKNIQNSSYDLFNNKFSNFPWPNIANKIENEDFYSKNFNNVKINFISKPDNSHKGSPKTCANVPMLCLASGREVCISQIFLKYNYLFINNQNKECLEQFKQNYWQH